MHATPTGGTAALNGSEMIRTRATRRPLYNNLGQARKLTSSWEST